MKRTTKRNHLSDQESNVQCCDWLKRFHVQTGESSPSTRTIGTSPWNGDRGNKDSRFPMVRQQKISAVVRGTGTFIHSCVRGPTRAGTNAIDGPTGRTSGC